MNRYSLDSDSQRWWWPSAGAGAAASLVIAAVLAAPSSNASAPVPAPDEGGSGLTVPGGPASGLLDCPPPPDPRYVGVPWVPPVKTGCASLDAWWADPGLPTDRTRRPAR